MARTIERGRARARQRGIGMLWALVSVALIGIYLMMIGDVWTTQATRIKEDELLRKGDAIRRAMDGYVRADPGSAYPKDFNDLLRDPRTSYVRRFLREAYPDPMINGPWQLITGNGDQWYGVNSSAEGTPLKQDNFPDAYANFALQSSYQDWKFTRYPEMGLQRR